jgi:hypothetical protein
MKVIMLSRLPELQLVPKQEKRTATERLKQHLYRKHPMRLLVGDEERADRRFWKAVATKDKRR